MPSLILMRKNDLRFFLLGDVLEQIKLDQLILMFSQKKNYKKQQNNQNHKRSQ